MEKTPPKFFIGDLVFAKVKGYSPWPAKITAIENKRYNVYFYGTGQTGNITEENIFPYTDFKEKLYSKQFGFREALEEIEAVLIGKDPAPIDTPVAAPISAADINNDEPSAVCDESAKRGAQSSQKPLATIIKIEAKALDTKSTDEILDPDTGSNKTSATIKIEPKDEIIDPDEGSAKTFSTIKKIKIEPKDEILDPDEGSSEISSTIVEDDFIQLSQELRSSLRLMEPDPNRCLKLLKKCKGLDLTRLIMLRNPKCVDTIRLLRRYVGNLRMWDLDAEELAIFNSIAESIRNEATLIFNSWAKVFQIKENENFWEVFLDQLESYEAEQE